MQITRKAAAHGDDLALLARVQQFNQAQVVSKLLHDLRNPVHSMRIAMELFGRLVEPQAEVAALLQRAARYVPPAQAAVATLTRQTERLAYWLQPPGEPAARALPVNEWLREIALLLRESQRAVRSSVRTELTDEVKLEADPARFGHALLRWAFTCGERVELCAAPDGAQRVRLELRGDATAADPGEDETRRELRTLFQSAGAAALAVPEGSGGVLLEVSFVRAREATRSSQCDAPGGDR